MFQFLQHPLIFLLSLGISTFSNRLMFEFGSWFCTFVLSIVVWFAFEVCLHLHPNLPQYTQLQMSTNIVGKVPAMD